MIITGLTRLQKIYTNFGLSNLARQQKQRPERRAIQALANKFAANNQETHLKNGELSFVATYMTSYAAALGEERLKLMQAEDAADKEKIEKLGEVGLELVSLVKLLNEKLEEV